MKKTYNKPQIVYESFELSQSIAGNCLFVTNQAYEACPSTVPDLDFTVFNDGMCDFTPATSAVGVCYQTNEMNANNAFSS